MHGNKVTGPDFAFVWWFLPQNPVEQHVPIPTCPPWPHLHLLARSVPWHGGSSSLHNSYHGDDGDIHPASTSPNSQFCHDSDADLGKALIGEDMQNVDCVLLHPPSFGRRVNTRLSEQTPCPKSPNTMTRSVWAGQDQHPSSNFLIASFSIWSSYQMEILRLDKPSCFTEDWM